MSEVKWVKLQADMFENRKIRQIELLPEADGIIVIWVHLICLAGQVNDNGFIYLTKEIPYTPEMLAQQFNKPLSTVQLALKTFISFEMIEVIEHILHISNWEKYQNAQSLEHIRAQNRLRKQKQRGRERLLLADSSENAQSRDTSRDVTQQNKNKNKNKNIYINSAPEGAQSVQMHSAEERFEQLWKLYPNKKGKGRVADKSKRALMAYSKEELERAIERYVSEWEKDKDWRKQMNGSTFFNSGYVDYLDDNFEPQTSAKIDSSMSDLDDLF